jgi:hypothetical protein
VHCCKHHLLLYSFWFRIALLCIDLDNRRDTPLCHLLTWRSSCSGLGWFFEWPGGRHPLNTTWPWADVKPSLVVLWGVCWMFAIDPRARVNMPFDAQYRQRPNTYNAGANVQYAPQATQYVAHPEPSRHFPGRNQFESSQRFGTWNLLLFC